MAKDSNMIKITPKFENARVEIIDGEKFLVNEDMLREPFPIDELFNEGDIIDLNLTILKELVPENLPK